MPLPVLLRLFLLAAIWGASFLFMRITAPALGFAWTASLRGTLAACSLLLLLLLQSRALEWRRFWKQYLILGALGSGFPYLLYAWAALHLPAGYSAILNATSPLWSVLLGLLFWQRALHARLLLGLACGVAGVALLVRLGPLALTPDVWLAVACCACATICYALAGEYTKRASLSIPVAQMACGSQITASLMLMPPTALTTALPSQAPLSAWLAVAALAIFCTAIAYLLYFSIVVAVGPTKALTVTFITPAFSLLWGWLFLHEHVTLAMLGGCVLVVLAMWLVSGPAPASTQAAASGTRQSS